MPEVASQATTVVPLPSLGADMDAGTVVTWCVAVGDRVERGDIVAVVSTEKSDIDVESWHSGVVTELLAPLDEEISVGDPLLALAPDETARPAAAPTTAAASPTASIEAAPTMSSRTAALPRQGGRTRLLASPLARREAARRGLDLGTVPGTGPGGAVLASDLPSESDDEAAAPSTNPPAAPSSSDPMRLAIAERMSRANREIPHYHLELDIDVSTALAWLTEHNADLPVARRVVPAALLSSAVARAARSCPRLNGTWVEDRFVASPTVDVGVVVSLRSGGLVTPTIGEADRLDLDELMTTMREMVTSARRGRLRSRWAGPASITITNLGDNGADSVTGIIFPPQVALVGFGRISERPWVVDGTVTTRSVVTASLAGDHRATDGTEGSRFLATIAAALEHPEAFEGQARRES